MKKININNELKTWLIDYITNTIHGYESEDSEEFNKWASPSCPMPYLRH